jgi:hypothetical protein
VPEQYQIDTSILMRTQNKLQDRLGHSPTYEELCAELGWQPAKLAKVCAGRAQRALPIKSKRQRVWCAAHQGIVCGMLPMREIALCATHQPYKGKCAACSQFYDSLLGSIFKPPFASA